MVQIPFLFGKSCHVNRVKHSVWQRVRLTGVPDWNHEMCEKKEQQRLNNSKFGDFNACVSSAPPPSSPGIKIQLQASSSVNTHIIFSCLCYSALVTQRSLPLCYRPVSLWPLLGRETPICGNLCSALALKDVASSASLNRNVGVKKECLSFLRCLECLRMIRTSGALCSSWPLEGGQFL